MLRLRFQLLYELGCHLPYCESAAAAAAAWLFAALAAWCPWAAAALRLCNACGLAPAADAAAAATDAGFEAAAAPYLQSKSMVVNICKAVYFIGL